MFNQSTLLSAVLLACFGLVASGCGQQYVKGTEIEYSKDRQALADTVERYRLAMIQRDSATLRKMTSAKYYENGSTTIDPSDDYGIDGLEKVFSDLKNNVRAAKYQIDIKEIDVMGDTARVDYEYKSQFLLGIGEQDRWSTKSDKNRLTFERVKFKTEEKGESERWLITGGL